MPRPLIDIPQVSVSEVTPSTSSDTDTPTPRRHGRRDTPPKTSGGYQKLAAEDTHSTTSDVTHLERVDTSLNERLAKSENLSVFSPEDPSEQLDRSRSPSLRKLMLSRFSFKRRQSSRKHADPSSNRNTLMVPFLQTQPADRQESGSKVRSKTSAALEERFVKPKEKGRGSFVVVRIKSPGPEDFLDRAFLKRLEENFRLNHMFGSLTVDLEESVDSIVRQGQVIMITPILNH